MDLCRYCLCNRCKNNKGDDSKCYGGCSIRCTSDSDTRVFECDKYENDENEED